VGLHIVPVLTLRAQSSRLVLMAVSECPHADLRLYEMSVPVTPGAFKVAIHTH